MTLLNYTREMERGGDFEATLLIEQLTGSSLSVHKRLQMNTPLFREMRVRGQLTNVFQY